MSDQNFIQEADRALQNHIWNALKSESTTQTLVTSQDQIAFSLPKVAQKASKVSVFLYRISEEASARNPQVLSGASRKQPQTCFSLHYVVVAQTGNEEDDHVLLGKIVQVLAAFPLITDTQNNESIKVTFDTLSLGEIAAFWTALGVPFRPSVNIALTSVVADSAQNEATISAAVISVSPGASASPQSEGVTKLYEGVRQTFTEQADGWKKSNLLRKQFVMQDFRKITEMTVDEMQAAVNILGDKLEMNRPTAQFLKPLTLLAKYYEHQADELKGLRGLSKKQKENVDMLNQWVKDVNALVEALSAEQKPKGN
jgi:Pvc16 N-terminal domain